VSSSVHGFMKPHPSIFEAALGLVGVDPGEAMMVGDSVRQDVGGARAVGMKAVLVCRSGRLPELPDGTPVVRTLDGIEGHL
jgi:putative hydrolase of the HAD superfamily